MVLPFDIDRLRAAGSDANGPTLVVEELRHHIQMSRVETIVLDGLLRTIRPTVAIEVGTFQGGSAELIARHAVHVYSIDISPTPRERLQDDFDAVTFLTGPSATVLPSLLRTLSDSDTPVEFVLIDGDHSASGVRADIESMLAYSPLNPLVLVLHDSFNPECRRGMLEARWSASPHVHLVEVDFVPGVFHETGFDTAAAATMWGGFAVAVMAPERRTGGLTIHQSQRRVFEAIEAISSHRRRALPARLVRRAKRILVRPRRT